MQSKVPWLYCISSSLNNVHFAVMTSEATYSADSSSRINAFTCPIQYREAAPMLEKAVQMSGSTSCSFYVSDRNSVVPISMETPNAVATFINQFNVYANNPDEWRLNFIKSTEPPATFLINLVRYIKLDNDLRLFFWVPFQNLQLLWQSDVEKAEIVFWLMAGQWSRFVPISQVIQNALSPSALLQQIQMNQQQVGPPSPTLDLIRTACKTQELFADLYVVRSDPPNMSLYSRSNNISQSTDWVYAAVTVTNRDVNNNPFRYDLQGYVCLLPDYVTVYLESEELAQLDQFAPFTEVPGYSYTQTTEDELGTITTYQSEAFQFRENVLFIQDGTNYVATLRYLFTRAQTMSRPASTDVFTLSNPQEIITIPRIIFDNVATLVIEPQLLRTASSSSIVVHTVASWVTLCFRPTEDIKQQETTKDEDQKKQKRKSNVGNPQTILTSVLMREIYASTSVLLNMLPLDLQGTLAKERLFQFVVQMVAITLYNMVSRDVAIIDVFTAKDKVINFTRPQNLEERDVENCFYVEQILFVPLVTILRNKDNDPVCKFLWEDYNTFPPNLKQSTFLMNAYQVWPKILNPIQSP